jgi:signal peptidase II
MHRMAWTAIVVFSLDQASKFLVVHALNLREIGRIDVVPPLLNLRMAWNRGVNFGLLSSEAESTKWLLIVVALLIAAWVVLWVRRDDLRPPALISAGLLLGGALGNVVDRLIYGAVADFINMSCCGLYNPFAFNIADIGIFAGAFGLVLFTGKRKTRDGADEMR